MDYVIELSSFGVSLRFNPILQILTSIRFSKMDEVILQYPMGSSGQVSTFSLPKKVATVENVYQTFGPTTHGKFESGYQHYVLEYPGLAFVFAVPANESELYSRNSLEVPSMEATLSLSFPLVALYCRPSDKEAQILTRDDALRELERRPYVEVQLGQSIAFYYPMSDRPGLTKTIMFGTHVQDVITSIGLPDARFTKPATAFSSSRVPNAPGNGANDLSTVLPEPDYFFNYFDLGVDILFDGSLHVAKKFILWTNLPSQPDFVRYSKCHYAIETRALSASSSSSSIRGSSNVLPPVPENIFPIGDEIAVNRAAIPEEEEAEHFGNPAPVLVEPMAPPVHRVDELRGSRPLANSEHIIPPTITPQMKWPEIQTVLGPPTGNPYWFPAREGAFGGMTYYAYSTVIFEVMKKDDYVSKIFLFPE